MLHLCFYTRNVVMVPISVIWLEKGTIRTVWTMLFMKRNKKSLCWVGPLIKYGAFWRSSGDYKMNQATATGVMNLFFY